VLGLLRGRCPWLADDEREAIYHDAYATLLEKDREGTLDVERMHDRQVRSYLMTAAIYRGLHEGKRHERKRTKPEADAGVLTPDPTLPVEERVAAASEAAPIREILEELPERRRALIKLRFWLDRSPDEIQAFLGISERTYRKEIERAFRQLAERFQLVREGRWCEERRSVVLAYVAGVAAPRRAKQARMHLESCPACSRMAAELRELAERAGAAAPMPDLAVGDGPFARLAEAGVHVREQLAETVGQAKTQAASFVSRADLSVPAYAAGTRPGAAVAVVAGCLAVGGSATYCAVEGLPDPLARVAEIQNEERAPAEPPTVEQPPEEEPIPEGPPLPPPPQPDLDSVPTTKLQPPPPEPAPAPAPEPPPPEPPAPAPEPANEFVPDVATHEPPTPAPAPTPAASAGQIRPAQPMGAGQPGAEFAP
jgi:RNA polymerase sigma factor (sigma-70 family)